MNRCFSDQKQNLHVKVLSTRNRARREIVGAEVFSKFVLTANPELIDDRTVLSAGVSGVLSDQVDEQILTGSVINLISKIYDSFDGKVDSEFSITATIDELLEVFQDLPEVVRFLFDLKAELKFSRFFPVHGDLQKQNMFFANGKLTLIDFEHFVFAPLELEVANSLFHCDKNCVDFLTIIPKLIKVKIFCPKRLISMLLLYSIKEITNGTSIKTVQQNYENGLGILRLFGDINLRTFPKKFQKSKAVPMKLSTCMS